MEHNRRGIGVSPPAAAAVVICTAGIPAGDQQPLSATFRVGSGATMIGASLSLALIGVGRLVGAGPSVSQ